MRLPHGSKEIDNPKYSMQEKTKMIDENIEELDSFIQNYLNYRLELLDKKTKLTRIT